MNRKVLIQVDTEINKILARKTYVFFIFCFSSVTIANFVIESLHEVLDFRLSKDETEYYAVKKYLQKKMCTMKNSSSKNSL